jgi:MYXO-CTERM domain-containing protein
VAMAVEAVVPVVVAGKWRSSVGGGGGGGGNDWWWWLVAVAGSVI